MRRVAAAAAAAAAAAGAEPPPAATAGVHTYVGRYTPLSQEFLGIPYAQQPVGALRWRPPQPLQPDPAPVTTNQDRFGPICPQLRAMVDMAGLVPNPDGTPQTISEACLFLNIFTPRNASAGSRLPVLVFGHGGGDGFGASSGGIPMLFNGTNMQPAAAAVVVTINYRLGTLGYLAHPAFATEDPEYPTTGNYGVLDHHQALTFVRDNIAAFGGDPARVLFFGQSSGANHALWIPVIPRFRGLVSAVASHSACGQPFYNPDCAMVQTARVAAERAEATAVAHNCTGGGDAGVRDCLRALPTSALALLSGLPMHRPVIDGHLLRDLPFNLYGRGEFSADIKIMAGHNSGESVEMADSCLNNPGLTFDDTPASFARAVKVHNRLTPPEWLASEAEKLYLPARSDGKAACSPSGDSLLGIPRCCRVYEDFWQDLELQCSEDELFTAIRAGATRQGVAPPPLYAWRFDQVEDCPPAISGWSGAGKGKLYNSSSHAMELGWMFGTVGAGLQKPANHASTWECTWDGPERAFSDTLIQWWTRHAEGAPPPEWPQYTDARRERLNLRIGNITTLTGFRRPFCDWLGTVYTRIRASQGYNDSSASAV